MQICNWSKNTFFLEKCNEIASCFTDINESKQIIIDLNKCKFGSVSEFLPYICLAQNLKECANFENDLHDLWTVKTAR